MKWHQGTCDRCDMWVPLLNDETTCGSCIQLMGMLPGTLQRRYRDAEAASQWDECTRIAAEIRRRSLTLTEAA